MSMLEYIDSLYILSIPWLIDSAFFFKLKSHVWVSHVILNVYSILEYMKRLRYEICRLNK